MLSFPAVQKRTPSASENSLEIGFQPAYQNIKKVRQLLTAVKRAPSCTGIPGLDILGCGEEKRTSASTRIPALDILGRVQGKRAPSCTGIPGLDILGCGEANSAPVVKRCNTGIIEIDMLCGVTKRAPGGTGLPLDLLARARQGKRAPSCTGIPGLDILGCGEAKRSPEKVKRAPSCTGIPGLDILGCGEAKRTPGGTGLPFDLLARARQGKRAPSCTGIPGLDILGCGEAKRTPDEVV